MMPRLHQSIRHHNQSKSHLGSLKRTLKLQATFVFACIAMIPDLDRTYVHDFPLSTNLLEYGQLHNSSLE